MNAKKCSIMKKTLTLIIILSFSIGAFCQSRALIDKELRDMAVTRTFEKSNSQTTVFTSRNGHYPFKNTTDLVEEQIGDTWYDLQSNTLLGNRIHLFPDGAIGAVWTRGNESPPNFPDRGTGYNYYDGSTWGPMPAERLESVRTGWPSYAPYGEDGEIVSSHDFGAAVIMLLDRQTKGTGAWNEWPTVAGPNGQEISWPRMTTSGVNHGTIHLLYTTWPVANGGTPYNGMDGALLYSRTSDGGATWDPLNIQLDGTGADYYNSISADEYIWAEPRGNTIAFVCADAWHDMFVMKSPDNGDTWEKMMVWEHPYPFFDWDVTITTDTIWCPDNSADIAIDAEGKVHVVCGISRVAHFEVGTTYQYWPFTDGIAYWNEDRPPFEASDQHDALDAIDVLVEDHDLIGWTQDINNNGAIDFLDELMSYRELGISTMPNITVNATNQIIVAYASTTEGYDNSTYNYKHIWVRGSDDNGATWLDFHDLNTDLIHIFDECIYPAMAGSTNDGFHVIYQADSEPGTALDEDHPYQENKIYHATMLLEDIGLSPVGIKETASMLESVSQNYPNPFSGTTYIEVVTGERTDLQVEVLNLTGQKVLSVDRGSVNSGRHLVKLDARHLSPGAYFYKVKAGGETFTGKMIVE